MAHLRGGERTFASIHNLLKMLLSPHQSSKSAPQEADMVEDIDEPPDHRFLNTSMNNMDDGVVYVKAPAAMTDRKESLLTRALKSTPPQSPADRHSPSQEHSFYRSYTYTNISGISTAELTSDGGLTSPSLSNTPSPPLPSHLTNTTSSMGDKRKAEAVEVGESAVEANLGRKRCISFACGRKAQEQKPQTPSPQRPVTKFNDASVTPTEPKRRTVLTFVCPARDPETRRERSPLRSGCRPRPRGSPAPMARKASPEKAAPSPVSKAPQEQKIDRRGVPTKGLGKFEESEATRFHEFASSVEEDDEWVTKSGEYPEKITLNDCMKKENAIRKLGEEAEEEALEEDDEDDVEDSDDDSTVHDFSSDDGNESDNEAGFAESDESDDGSEYDFWAPTSTTAATSPQNIDIARHPFSRRDSNTSFDSANDAQQQQRWSPVLAAKTTSRSPMKIPKLRPGTPNLPDSTDFVCGTFDEDRPLEAAYKSCIEQRRLSKQIVIPQDIDPSFPTSDPEDEEDEDDDIEESVLDEGPRGRTGRDSAQKPSPRTSPRRMISPPPRRQGRSSPKRLRSPPPPMKLRSSKDDLASADEAPTVPSRGLNISELVQRPAMSRTKSLPRTPNPFFTSLDKSHRWSGIVPVYESPERESSRTREVHTRGPIDIVEGLEKKRQKRKEKFWRQHCRKAAKEQMVRRPIPGKGAERMKELGLEVAERCRAYGVGENAQLVLSV
ncbi:DUF2457 domain-containing protein [Aspergillus vadensis CBS 113365]|uniref:Uncharacterized protein n=1 Tax=Aspergillus vadensis (strain CBS 113365 / IMI 142717 / IBT 24658) TaxID=1448311 RepID=A0A319C703_ASPVC|nr:hypothetical protein BO88DRAFT_429377 [Aspergillus vadensis CBS 113365]PYH64612.1 hypothetical protein BO88DRAFT_429377 [Aspergillus vadensis CBS 113365]